MSFPFFPVDGQDYTNAFGTLYQYDSTRTAWLLVGCPGGTLPTDLVRTSDSITVLADVDTSSNPPSRDWALKWNGLDWVPAPYNYSFAMTIASFISNQAVSQVMGVAGTAWKDPGVITFTASYNNPPPADATITLTSNGGVTWSTPLALVDPYTAGSSDETTNYPNDKDKYITFTLTAHDGVTPRTSTTTVTFYNYVYWGDSTKNTDFSEGEIEALSGSALTNAYTTSRSINAGASDYLVIAFPSSYAPIATGQSYEIDGTTGFLFNGVSCAMQLADIASVTNSAGFVENYQVYASYQKNDGNSLLQLSTSNLTINRLYYGITIKTDSYAESDVEGLVNSSITNNNKQTWNSVTAGIDEYLLFAFPKRLGEVSFTFGMLTGGFLDPETVDVTNVNGWAENYYVWRSLHSNIGPTVIVTGTL